MNAFPALRVPAPDKMYHLKFKQKVDAAPDTLGATLGRLAIAHDIPVIKIARAIGATRQSVYNWMKGGDVFVAYRPAVMRVINSMRSSGTAE